MGYQKINWIKCFVFGFALSTGAVGAVSKADPSQSKPTVQKINLGPDPKATLPGEAVPPPFPVDEANGFYGRVPDRLQNTDISKVISQNLPSIRACYNQALARNVELNGKMLVNFTIGMDGKVSNVRTKETSLQDKDMETCVHTSFQKIQFPASSKLVEISYPLTFYIGGID